MRRGHDVTLFACGGSRTSARLRPGSSAPLWELPAEDRFALALLQVENVVRCSDEFDVVHSHIDALPWLAGERIRAPLVTTLHGRLDLPVLRSLFATYRDRPLISISHAQRAPLQDLDLNWAATIHHGLDLECFPAGRGAGGYVAFVGRISPEKDPAAAIRVAVRAGVPLRIAARVDPGDEAFFRRDVAPFLDHPLITWLGEVDDREKARLLGDARALLMPIDWPEPFGLVFIEALACGTPVVTRPRGALPEIVRDGEHGRLVETEDEMVRALGELGWIDRAACRAHAVARFSARRMADDHEHMYRSVLAGGKVPALR